MRRDGADTPYDVELEGHYSYKRLFKYVLPSVCMMVVASIYNIVDGFFISNYAGKDALAAVNLVIPVDMALSAVGFMIGSGGSALVSFTLGEGRREQANRIFSMLVAVLTVVGVVISAIGYLCMPGIARLLGASEQILGDCTRYGRILMISLTGFMLQNAYLNFLMAAGKGKLGLIISSCCGGMNIILDYILVYRLDLGIIGAGTATAVCELSGGVIPTIYFLCRNKSALRLARFPMLWRELWKTCTNGISEMLTNLSASVVSMLYNWQLLRIAKEDGVAAYGAIMYVGFIFMSVFFGYSMGINPLVGYQYGAGQKEELRSIRSKAMKVVVTAGMIMVLGAELLSGFFVDLYVGYDRELYALTLNGFRIYSIAFVFSGFNIFASAFFTGLNNGLVSGMISFSRTFVFQVIAVLILPALLGINGVWIAVTVAEACTLLLSVGFFWRYRSRYQY